MAPCGPAPPEDFYPDIDQLYNSIQAFAKINGYAFSRRDKKAKRVVFICDRGGPYNPKGKKAGIDPSKQRQTATKKSNCQMKIAAIAKGDGWRVQVIEPTHNHEASSYAAAHTSHRRAALGSELKAEIIAKAQSGIKNAQILSFLRLYHPTHLTGKDISNIIQATRAEELGGRTPLEWLLLQLKEKDCNPTYTVDDANRLVHLFFPPPIKENEPLFQPLVVNGKGRPKGALGKAQGPNANSSTKRLPSAFELPSSSAPPAIESSTFRSPPLQEEPGNKQIYITRTGRTATRIGLQRIQEVGDTYEPGTMPERAYRRGISSIFHTDSIVDTEQFLDKAITTEVVEESQKTQDCIVVEV
ncbi:hypothetical protein B7463_g6990, partial [Scytalidium lignicola]